jgi:hypothetical protein
LTTWNRSMKRLPPSKKHGVVVRCQSYFDQAREQQLSSKESLVSAKLYSALLDSLKETGNGEQADIVFSQMISDVLSGNAQAMPTVATLNSLMTAWARSRSADAPLRAEALLERMKQLHEDEGWDLVPDVTTYNVILNCWAKSGREEAPERAEAIVRLMEEEDDGTPTRPRPDARTYAAVLDAWSRSGLPHAPARALQYFSRLVDRFRGGEEHCRPTQFHFAAVMNTLATHGDYAGVERLMESMGSTGLSPNTYCYNALIKAIVQSGESDAGFRCEAVLERMKSDATAGASPDIATYSSCISAWENHSSDEGLIHAQALLDECLDRTASPTVAPFVAFLRVVSQSNRVGKTRKANKAVERMKELGIARTRHVWEAVEKCRSTDPAYAAQH